MATDDHSAGAEAKTFDLEERTAKFGEAVIALAKRVRQDAVSTPIISQVVRAAVSVGANYCEANDAETRKDFRHKMGLCRKESHECKHHLRMLAAADPAVREDARRLWAEAKELNLIFSSIVRRLDANGSR